MLDDGKISAYFGDRSILVSLIKDSKAPGKLVLAENYLSVEPYALALPHGDDDFRLAVDRALSHIYRSGEIAADRAPWNAPALKLGSVERRRTNAQGTVQRGADHQGAEGAPGGHPDR